MRKLYACAEFGRYKTVRAALCLTVLLSVVVLVGCPSETAAHVTALATATAPVVDEAAATYAGANAIHAMRTDYDAITQFEATSPVYNPRTVPPLLSEQEIKARLAVLAAFQAYVQSLTAITNDADTPQMQAAAKSAGSGLSNVTNTLAPSVETAFGIAKTVPTTVTTVTTTPNGTTASVTNSATATNPISTTTGNMISTGIDALEQFLVQRRLKKDLPKIVSDMDPMVKQLCDLLANDITNLKVIERIDYNYVIDHQTLFLRENTGKMDPGVRSMMITRLPEVSRQQKMSDAQLTQLAGAILNLELTHHAFAADLQGNNPSSIKQKLADLEAAGADLGKFYASL
jgi:hypothetical protein